MNRIKALILSVSVAAFFIFIINIVFFATFKDIYSSNIYCILAKHKPLIFGFKTAGASLIISFVMALAFDLSYGSLPGGVFRKTLNFGSMTFLIVTGSWIPILYSVSSIQAKFYVVLMLQYAIICFTSTSVMAAIYHEMEQRIVLSDGLKSQINEVDNDE